MATTPAGCPFCQIVQGDALTVREIYRDEHSVGFLPLEPATLGHTLLVPQKHMPDIWSLSQADAARLAVVTVRLAHAVRRAMQPEGMNIIQSNGVAATQTVAHLHVHIVPRWSTDRIGSIWPAGIQYSDVAQDEVWGRIRREIQRG